MPLQRFCAFLGLARQGIEIGAEFGLHSVEAIAWIGLAVEAAVYRPKSFVRTPGGIRFTLANPPLRIGAFSALRVGIDGQPPSARAVRWRVPSSGTWRTAADLSVSDPLHFRPGEPLEFDVDLPAGKDSGPITVHLELQSVAIPPLVWFEFTDTPRPAGATP